MSMCRIRISNLLYSVPDIFTVCTFSVVCILTILTYGAPASAAIDSEEDNPVINRYINATEIVQTTLVLGFATGVFKQLLGQSKENKG